MSKLGDKERTPWEEEEELWKEESITEEDALVSFMWLGQQR